MWFGEILPGFAVFTVGTMAVTALDRKTLVLPKQGAEMSWF